MAHGKVERALAWALGLYQTPALLLSTCDVETFPQLLWAQIFRPGLQGHCETTEGLHSKGKSQFSQKNLLFLKCSEANHVCHVTQTCLLTSEASAIQQIPCLRPFPCQ